MQWCEQLGARGREAWQGLFQRIGYQFGPMPMRQRATEQVQGLLSPVEHKNGWHDRHIVH